MLSSGSSRPRSVGDTPESLRDRALLEVLYGIGARISEAVGLDVDDIDVGLDGSSTATSAPASVSSGCGARATRSGSCRWAATRSTR